MNLSRETARAIAGRNAPPWTTQAADLLFECEGGGLRVTRFRLTASQAEELERYTGQRSYLLGYPVAVKHGPSLRLVG